MTAMNDRPVPSGEQADRELAEDAGREDRWEEVTLPRPRRAMSGQVTVRLEESALQRLRQAADDRGIGHTALARMLLVQGLDRLTSPRPVPAPLPDSRDDAVESALVEMASHLEAAGSVVRRMVTRTGG